MANDTIVQWAISMTILENEPITLAIPLREDPPGVLRVGKSRVLLELVVRAHQRGASPEQIVESFEALDLRDVFAVIAYYLANPAQIDDYLRNCEKETESIRRKIEKTQPPLPRKEELLARARAKGIIK
jgi:uncharacterized protein (DUF433 family)